MRLSGQSRLAIVVTILWFLAAVTPGWRPTSDSALYLMLGQSLARGDGYALGGLPESAVPPGYPALLAVLERAGLGSMFCLNAMMGILGLLTVWVSYFIVREIASRPVAVLIGGLMGINALLHLISARQLSDIPFTLFALVGIYGLLCGLRGKKGALEIGTLAIIASCWIRVTGFPLAGGCLIAFFAQPNTVSRVRVLVNACILVVGVLGTAGAFYSHYQYCQHTQPPLPDFIHVPAVVQTPLPVVAHDSPTIVKQDVPVPATPPAQSTVHIEPVQSTLPEPNNALAPISYLPLCQELLAHPTRLFKNLYDAAPLLSVFLTGQELPAIIAQILFVLPLLIGLWRGFSQRQYLTTLAVVSYVGAVVAALPSDARYLLPVAPLLMLYYLEGISFLLDWPKALRAYSPRLLFVLIALVCVLNVVRGAGAVYRDSQVITHRTAELKGPAKLLQVYARPGEQLVSSDKERELAYLSGVPFAPLDRGALIAKLPREHYLRFLFDRGLRYAVISDDRVRSMPDYAVFCDAVHDRRMFEPIGNCGHFHVYRFHAPPPVSNSAATVVSSQVAGAKAAR